MKTNFIKSFEKDLQKILDADLFHRVQELINSFKNLKMRKKLNSQSQKIKRGVRLLSH